ncbi:MAG: prepilin-type N-terminal cleavage/methylation domain-containing protein, partial [Bacteriovoracaceae bacterium]
MKLHRRNENILNRLGFTLVEVMISIAILSFIMLAVISVTGSSQDTALRVVEEDREILQVETAMSRLEWDISQVYSPLYFSHAMEPSGLTEQEGNIYNQMVDKYAVNDRYAFPSFEGLPAPNNKIEDKKTLTLFTSSNRRKFKNSKQSHFAWVQYGLLSPEEAPRLNDDPNSLKEEEEGDVLVRKFLSDNVFASEEIPWDDVKSQVLLRGVKKMLFEFWNPDNKKWTENLATIKEGQHKIHGIKLTLEWLDPDGIERTFIRVFRPLFPHFKAENMYKLQ